MGLPESIDIWDSEASLVDPELDLMYVDRVALDIAAILECGDVAEAAYQPGDGTFYGIVLVPLRSLFAARPRVKDGRTWQQHAVSGMGATGQPGYVHDGYLLTLVENVSYPIRLGNRGRDLAADYIAEHWKLPGASAVSVVLLLRAISHHLDRHAAGRGDTRAATG